MELLWLNKFFYWPLTPFHTKVNRTRTRTNESKISSVADPGCFPRILIFSIPDPGSFFHPGSTASNYFSILTQKIVSKLSEKWSGLFIPDSDPGFFTHSGSRGPKRHRIPDPQHCIYRRMNISGATPAGWPTWTWPGIHHPQSINAPENPSSL
jgi:hypothetical protein